jgi:hypothetical protein
VVVGVGPVQALLAGRAKAAVLPLPAVILGELDAPAGVGSIVSPFSSNRSSFLMKLKTSKPSSFGMWRSARITPGVAASAYFPVFCR